MHKRLTSQLTIKGTTTSGTFEGYASVFHVEDYYRDVVMPGAFTKSLAAHRARGSAPALLLFHDHARPCGVWEDMAEDDHGLFVRGQLLLGTRDGAEAFELVKAGALTGLSIGYRPVVEQFDRAKGVNELLEIDLWETSLVTFPANEAARVEAVKTIRDFERLLVDQGGFSRNQAKAIAVRGFSGATAKGAFDEARAIAALKNNIQLFRCK